MFESISEEKHLSPSLGRVAGGVAAAVGRRRIWEIDRIFRCPLMGMCLSGSEQRQLLKKAGFSLKGRGAYEIHEALIGACGGASPLSRKIESLLEKKFGRLAAPLRELSEADFMKHWRSAMESGVYEGALWAAATRPCLSEKNQVAVFGDVHMAMHESAQDAARIGQRLSLSEARAEEFKKTAREIARERDLLKSENADLLRRIEALETLSAKAGQERERLLAELGGAGNGSGCESGRAETERLKAELAELRKKIELDKARIEKLSEKNAAVGEKLKNLEKSQEGFVEHARLMIGRLTEMNRCDSGCPSFDLCKKRILIVGGITKMEALYRGIVEGGGGIFEYHDGYMKSGAKGLEDRLKRADVVICPVNCNSHGACSMVKTLCKKYNKPMHMLPSSSLSAISQAVGRMGAQEKIS